MASRVFRVGERIPFLGNTIPTRKAEPSLLKPKANLSELCNAVLNDRHDAAKALALHLSKPKPKGSSFLHAWFDGHVGPTPAGMVAMVR